MVCVCVRSSAHYTACGMLAISVKLMQKQMCPSNSSPNMESLGKSPGHQVLLMTIPAISGAYFPPMNIIHFGTVVYKS